MQGIIVWAGSVVFIALLAYRLGKLQGRNQTLQKTHQAYEKYRKIHQDNSTRSRTELLKRLRNDKTN